METLGHAAVNTTFDLLQRLAEGLELLACGLIGHDEHDGTTAMLNVVLDLQVEVLEAMGRHLEVVATVNAATNRIAAAFIETLQGRTPR